MKNIHLLLLFFLVVSCGACKKTNTPSYSKFRIQHLDYIAIIYVNSVKLSNGNYLTLDQDIDFLHINLGEYDTASNLVFLKKHTYNSTRNITSCIPFNDGFLITGTTNSNGAYFATMFDANANALWDSVYLPVGNNTNIYPVACCKSTDGNILLVASQQDHGSSQTKISPPFLVKISPQSGKVLSGPISINGIDSSFECWVSNVYERPDGVYMSGFYFTWGINSWAQGSMICLKAQENGNVQWFYSAPVPPANTNLTGNPYINAYNIAETGSGPIVLTGITNTQFSTASVYYFNNYWYPMIGNTLAYAFDPASGNIVGSAIFDINNKTTYPIIHPANDGGFIIATTGNNFLNSFTVPTMVMLIKTDARFNVQWQKTFNSNGSNYIVLGVFPLNNGYEIVGQSNNIVNNKSSVGTFLMKTDLHGNLTD